MKKSNVPQDIGLAGRMSEISYAVNKNGRYELVQSYGWDPKTTSLKQAWKVIIEEIEDVIKNVKAGKVSPLAYHMAKNQMNTGLLAKYTRISRWRVKRHLKPEVFNHLDPAILERYAGVFEITPEQLAQVPDSVDFSFFKNWK